MRHARLWCLLGPLSLAALGCPAAAAEDAAAYEASCAGCHPSATALSRKIGGTSEAERKANLEGFLKHHHAPDPATSGSIAEFLLARPRK